MTAPGGGPDAVITFNAAVTAATFALFADFSIAGLAILSGVQLTPTSITLTMEGDVSSPDPWVYNGGVAGIAFPAAGLVG